MTLLNLFWSSMSLYFSFFIIKCDFKIKTELKKQEVNFKFPVINACWPLVCVCVCVCLLLFTSTQRTFPFFTEEFTCTKYFIVRELHTFSHRMDIQLGIIQLTNSDISLNCFSWLFFLIEKQKFRYDVLVVLLFEVQVC